MTKSRANLVLIIITAMWGSTYILNKLVTQAGMGPATTNACRGLMCVIFGTLFFHQQLRCANTFDFIIGGLVGVINFAGYFLRIAGLETTTPGKSALLTVTYVIFTPLVLWIVWHERPQAKLMIAVPLSLIGMWLITGMNHHSWSAVQTGDFLTIISAICWAGQIIIFSKYAYRASSPWIIIVIIGLMQTILGGTLAFSFERNQWGHIQWPNALIPLFFVAVVVTFLARSWQIKVQHFTDPSSASLILMSESLFATLFSILFGFDHLTWSLAIGGLLILLANLIMNYSPQQHLKTSK